MFSHSLKMKRLLSVLLLLLSTLGMSTTCAQDWLHVHVNYDGYEWAFPYSITDISFFDFDADSTTFQMHRTDNERLMIPFGLEKEGRFSSAIDSITFSESLDNETKNKYKVFALNITTDDGVEITSKEDYVRCYVSSMGEGSTSLIPVLARYVAVAIPHGCGTIRNPIASSSTRVASCWVLTRTRIGCCWRTIAM